MTAVPAVIGSLALCGYEALSGIDEAILDAIPGALCISSAAGVILRHNRHAAEWPEWPDPSDSQEAGFLIAGRYGARNWLQTAGTVAGDAIRLEAVLHKFGHRPDGIRCAMTGRLSSIGV
jgi:hypothetical protein